MTTSETTTQPPAVRAIGERDGEARWWWGTLAVLKLTGEQTHGGLTVVDVTMGAGRMAPPHVHHREDETFLVLEGSVSFTIGDQRVEAGPGELVAGPRDVPHRFAAGPDGARLLFLIAPAGLEGLILEQSVPATSRTLPPAGATAPDLERAREVALRYGCELLIR
jgi:quercetin dioxygenase-like cupin family protein